MATDDDNLPSPARICCACDEPMKPDETATKITENCDHEKRACDDCVAIHCVMLIEEQSPWFPSSNHCAECRAPYTFNDFKRWAEPEKFKKYDRMLTRLTLDKIEGFRWCMNPNCENGAIYPIGCVKAECDSCHHFACVRHDIPWHENETCDEYDARTKNHQEDGRLSKQSISDTCKECPSCKRAVYKWDGCPHMTCQYSSRSRSHLLRDMAWLRPRMTGICGHQWCWKCRASYTQLDIMEQDHMDCPFGEDY
ncbi:hypothetical protein F5Y16DRAFT_402974 [Xylariaceae sp. FL0255]|nr:hypothetical protein F5Y16DRAFT_402974 [Xylariaceae sp. FL0255]